MGLTASYVRDHLRYEPKTGHFYWRKRVAGRPFGRPAGSTNKSLGYVMINIDGQPRLAHRLVFLYLYGSWPAPYVDHINGVRNDNRLANLRVVNTVQHCWNRSLRKTKYGFAGIYQRENGSYRARIRFNGRTKMLGTFPTALQAHEAYKQAIKRYSKGFARS